MTTRRTFIKTTGLASMGLISGHACAIDNKNKTGDFLSFKKPVVISTWKNGVQANAAAWDIINRGGRSLDAVENGVKVVENDPEDMSVGYGGRPDRDGHVTLDACIMDENGNCGSVCALEHIRHPISVARKVMEDTPHVMLASAGALQFALEKGFPKENLLTEKARKEWEEWLQTAQYKPIINIENHDTIGMLAIDTFENMSGACTTSGMAYKLHGRVGDSPIIGAGMFCDNEVGGAVATGTGELVMRTLGSFLAVELLRNGASPQEAAEEVVNRIIKKTPDYKDHQIGLLVLSKSGDVGAYAIQPGFNYAIHSENGAELIDSGSFL